MNKLRFFATAVLFALSLTGAAVEPIIGIWQLDHQEMNGQKKETEPLTLRISPEADKFFFAFSVPVNNIDFVSLTYVAKLDGTEAEVKNARGEKVGTVQITTSSQSHYKILLKGQNRPETNVRLTVSADGKVLTSDSESIQAGNKARLIQSFTRR